MTKVQVVKGFEYLNKDLNSRTGEAIIFNSKDGIMTTIGYSINSLSIKSSPEANTVIFTKAKTTTWDDSCFDLKYWLAENKKSEILFIEVYRSYDESYLKKQIGRFLTQ